MFDQHTGGRKFGNSTYDVKPPMGNGFGGGMRSYGSSEIGANVKSVDWNRVNLQRVKKDIYEESEEVAKRPKSEIDAWLSKNEVILQGDAIPRPIMEFKESQFPGTFCYNKNKKPMLSDTGASALIVEWLDNISFKKFSADNEAVVQVLRAANGYPGYYLARGS